MGDENNQNFDDPISTIKGLFSPIIAQNNEWVSMNDDDDDICDSISTMYSSFEDSITSNSSSSSLDLVENASTSSNNSNSSSSHNGPLYELSELMAHLPIKRGLSKHFEGKSQSFTCLSNVSCLDDLGKRERTRHFRKMKTWKSNGGRLDIHNKTISKSKNKSSSSSSRSSSSFATSFGKRIVFLDSPKRPPIHPAKRSFLRFHPRFTCDASVETFEWNCIRRPGA